MHFTKIWILVLTLFSAPLFAQDGDLKAYAQHVDSLMGLRVLHEKELKDMSDCGGWLRGYYEEDKLVCLLTRVSGEISYTETKWYVRHGQLVKTVAEAHERIPPKDWDVFCKENKDADGNCNYAALKETVTTVAVTFSKKSIFTCMYDGKPFAMSVAEKENYGSEKKNCFAILLSELNGK